MRNFKWMLCQMLPLTYRSHYHDQAGKSYFAVWRMWLGRVFAYECVVVAE